MKKTVITVLMLLVASVLFAQLGPSATVIKEDLPDSYAIISSYAVNEYGNDHEMVLWEINRQCEAMINVIEKGIQLDHTNSAIYTTIFVNAIAEWSYDDTAENNLSSILHTIKTDNALIGVETLYLTVDWIMAEAMINNQLEAAEVY